MKGLKIEIAQIANILEIQELFVQTIKSTCSKDYSEAQIEVWTKSVENKERWTGLIEEQYFLKAVFNDKIVGFGTLDYKKGAYLDFLYAHKDYLRRGIAKSLLDALSLENTRRREVHLKSDVSITARPFFEQNGFKVIKENINVMSNGIELINFHMQKDNNQP